ncbi:PepSY domain-containing protein [Stackebrandtia nassauensis]|nr:PepSY domain-containing protein [Stackebrandtia nassauensis]
MRTRNVISAVGAAALSVVLLGACGDGDDDAGDNDKDDSTSASASGDDGAASPDPNVGSGAKIAVAAMDTAAADVKGGKVLDLDRDDDSGGQQWETTVAEGTKAEYELRVSADGTKVESNNKDNDLDEDLAQLADAKLSAQDAAKRAAKDHPGDVTGVDFDVPDGGGDPTWQVTLNDNGSATEYTLDADSGKTLNSEADD